MGRIFGTDGVRGIANEKLDVELALAISRAAGMIIKAEGVARPKILVGRDTRLSGEMLQCAVAAGLSSVGCDVELLGVVPTPTVAYLVKRLGANGGVMITASHNPFMYNGIKYFGGDGFKLTDAQEDRIERIILDGEEPIEFARTEHIGTVHVNYGAVEIYEEHIASAVKHDLSALRIAVDCANGASYRTAKKIFGAAGANATFINCEPDGTNVNKKCGSLFTQNLGEFVKKGGFDLGIAFDGDADRCLACDEKGQELDGDKIIALLAMAMKDKGCLDGNTAVVTVMSNLGFVKYMESQGINTEKTAVGDRYVLENMRENGYAIGGEQSGHVILLHHATTGDGELTAGKLLRLLAESGKKMSELNGIYAQYPQVLVNVVANAAQKAAYKADEVLAGFIENEEQKLMGMGRVLVRVSGTEPKIRVMVEGQDLEAIDCCAKRIVEKINKRILEGLEG